PASLAWLLCREVEWVRRLGAFAADAHGCIMVRVSGPTEYKHVARLVRAPSELPSDRHPDPQQASRRCSEPPSRPNNAMARRARLAPARPPRGSPAPPGETLDKRSTDRTRKLTMKKSRTSSHKTRLTTKSPYKLASAVLKGSRNQHR